MTRSGPAWRSSACCCSRVSSIMASSSAASYQRHGRGSKSAARRPHAVLDVEVEQEVQLLPGQAVGAGEGPVDLVEDRLALARVGALDPQRAEAPVPHRPHPRMATYVLH